MEKYGGRPKHPPYKHDIAACDSIAAAMADIPLQIVNGCCKNPPRHGRHLPKQVVYMLLN
jgi:hypothetical protein